LGAYTQHPPGKVDPDTTGVPMSSDIEIRVDNPDINGVGEIVVRHPNMFLGYYKNPEASAADIKDGWMHSGDVGRFDASGYLCVTGRKKDLIITAHGKNISPQEIEGRLQLEPLVSEAVVIGDGRPYLTALLTLDADSMAPWAEAHRKALDPEALAWDPDVRAEIQASVERVNATLSHVETIKKWRILPRDLTVASGEMTPTLKVRRKTIGEQYEDLVDEMYAETA
jgi:long-chain acyl-CoA synthetase